MVREWKLSQFDKFSLGMTIKCAWLYGHALDYAAMSSALVKIFGMYPYLGGLYVEKKGALIYDDALTVEPSFRPVNCLDRSVSEFSSDPDSVWTLVPKYDVKGFKKGTVRPFSARLVNFKDGSALIVQCAHAAMDGSTFFGLVRQWAELAKGGEVVPMVADQNLLPSAYSLTEPETLERVREAGWVKLGFGQLFRMMVSLAKNQSVKKTFAIEVSQEEIESLKAASGVGTNAVLSAIAAKKLFSFFPARESFKLITVADLRGRCSGVGEDFMGNFAQAVPAAGRFPIHLETSALAKMMDQRVRESLEKAGDNVRLSFCASHYSLPYFMFDPSDMNGSNPGTIYVNNQLKFRACELDWGAGMPLCAVPGDLKDMVKFWQPTVGGPIQIVFGGTAAKLFD